MIHFKRQALSTNPNPRETQALQQPVFRKRFAFFTHGLHTLPKIQDPEWKQELFATILIPDCCSLLPLHDLLL